MLKARLPLHLVSAMPRLTDTTRDSAQARTLPRSAPGLCGGCPGWMAPQVRPGPRKGKVCTKQTLDRSSLARLVGSSRCKCCCGGMARALQSRWRLRLAIPDGGGGGAWGWARGSAVSPSRLAACSARATTCQATHTPPAPDRRRPEHALGVSSRTTARGEGVLLECPRPAGLWWSGGGGVGTRPWWLALLACGGAYWPLALEPSAMTSRHPYYCGHPHCRGHPSAWGGGDPECNFWPGKGGCPNAHPSK